MSPELAAECENALTRVRASAFHLALDRIGNWRRPGVLWLGTSRESAPIQALAEQVWSNLAAVGSPRESRPFRTHVTLARKVERLPHIPRFQPIDWPVKRFSLTASAPDPAGVRYSNIREWTLPQANPE